MPGFLTYWHTLRYLKPVQFYGRIRFRLSRSKVDSRPAPAPRIGRARSWVTPAPRQVSLVGPDRFRFLNQAHALADHGWDDPALDTLWRFNLHYFDDLSAPDGASRADWHQAILTRWVRENSPGLGIAWEPYPTSLRIVNWVKWALEGNVLPSECVQSLAVQARWLTGRLERHLLGNHLFANAKALVFAGLFFDGAEATMWLEKGLGILESQVPEQILADGGQFERSPMYHALALEDMLDLLNVTSTLGQAMPAGWPSSSPGAPPPSGLEDLTARITLRLPETLKTIVDAAAQEAGVSANTWLLQQITRSADPKRRNQPGGRRMTGYGQS